jgi:hypothetical protein
MNDKPTEFELGEAPAIEATELEAITTGMAVRSGVKAGLQPCI